MFPQFLGKNTGGIHHIDTSRAVLESSVGNTFPTWKMISHHIRKVEATPLNPIRRGTIVDQGYGQAAQPILDQNGVSTGYQFSSGSTLSGTPTLAGQMGSFGGVPGSGYSLFGQQPVSQAGKLTTLQGGAYTGPYGVVGTDPYSIPGIGSTLATLSYGDAPDPTSTIYPDWSDKLRAGAIVHSTIIPFYPTNPYTTLGYSHCMVPGHDSTVQGYVRYVVDDNTPTGYARAIYSGPLPNGYFGVVWNGNLLDEGVSGSIRPSPYGQGGSAWGGFFPPGFGINEGEIFVSLAMLGDPTTNSSNPVTPLTQSTFVAAGKQGTGENSISLVNQHSRKYAGNGGIGYRLGAILASTTNIVPVSQCPSIHPRYIDEQGNTGGGFYNAQGGAVYNGPGVEHLLVEEETGIPIDPVTGRPMSVLSPLATAEVINLNPLVPVGTIATKLGPSAPGGLEFVASNGLGFDTRWCYFYDRQSLVICDPNTKRPYPAGVRPAPPLTPFSYISLIVPEPGSPDLAMSSPESPHKYGVIYQVSTGTATGPPTTTYDMPNSPSDLTSSYSSFSTTFGNIYGGTASPTPVSSTTMPGSLVGAQLMLTEPTTPGGELVPGARTLQVLPPPSGTGPTEVYTPLGGDDTAPAPQVYDTAVSAENGLKVTQSTNLCGITADGMNYPINIGYLTTQMQNIYGDPINNGAPLPKQDTFTRDVREGTPLVYGYRPTEPPVLPVYKMQGSKGIKILPLGQYTVYSSAIIPQSAPDPTQTVSNGQSGPSPDQLGSGSSGSNLSYVPSLGLYYHDNGSGNTGYYNYNQSTGQYSMVQRVGTLPTTASPSTVDSPTNGLASTSTPTIQAGDTYIAHHPIYPEGSVDPQTGQPLADKVESSPEISVVLNDHYAPPPLWGDFQLDKKAQPPEHGHRSGLTVDNKDICNPNGPRLSYGLGVSLAKSPYSGMELNDSRFPGLRNRVGPGIGIDSKNRLTTRGLGDEYRGILGVKVDSVLEPDDVLTVSIGSGAGLLAGEYWYVYTYTTVSDDGTGRKKESKPSFDYARAVTTGASGVVSVTVPAIDTTAADYDSALANVASRRIYRTVKNGGLSATPPVKSSYSLSELQQALSNGNISTIENFGQQLLCAEGWQPGDALTDAQVQEQVQISQMEQNGGILAPTYYLLKEVAGTDKVTFQDTTLDPGLGSQQPPTTNKVLIYADLAVDRSVTTDPTTGAVTVTEKAVSGLVNNYQSDSSATDYSLTDQNGLRVNVDNTTVFINDNNQVTARASSSGGSGKRMYSGYGGSPSDPPPPDVQDWGIDIVSLGKGNKWMQKHMNPGQHKYWVTTVYARQDKKHPGVWHYGDETQISAPMVADVPDYNNDNFYDEQNSNDDLYAIQITIPETDNRFEDKDTKISYYNIYRNNIHKDQLFLAGQLPHPGTTLPAGNYQLAYSYRSSDNGNTSPRSPITTASIQQGDQINVSIPSVSPLGPFQEVLYVDFWVQAPGGDWQVAGSQELPTLGGSSSYSTSITTTTGLNSSVSGGGGAGTLPSPTAPLTISTIPPPRVDPKTRTLPHPAGENPWIWRQTPPNNCPGLTPAFAITTLSTGEVITLDTGMVGTDGYICQVDLTQKPPQLLAPYSFSDDITDEAMQVDVPLRFVKPQPDDPWPVNTAIVNDQVDIPQLISRVDGAWNFAVGDYQPPISSPPVAMSNTPGKMPPEKMRKVRMNVSTLRFPKLNSDGSLWTDTFGSTAYVEASGLTNNAGPNRNEVSVYLSRRNGAPYSGLHLRKGEKGTERGGLGISLMTAGGTVSSLPKASPADPQYPQLRAGMYISSQNQLGLDLSGSFAIGVDPDLASQPTPTDNAGLERWSNKLIYSTCVHMPGSLMVNNHVTTRALKSGALVLTNVIKSVDPTKMVGCDVVADATQTNPIYNYSLTMDAMNVCAPHANASFRDGTFQRQGLPPVFVNSFGVGGQAAQASFASLNIHGFVGGIGLASVAPGITVDGLFSVDQTGTWVGPSLTVANRLVSTGLASFDDVAIFGTLYVQANPPQAVALSQPSDMGCPVEVIG